LLGSELLLLQKQSAKNESDDQKTGATQATQSRHALEAMAHKQSCKNAWKGNRRVESEGKVLLGLLALLVQKCKF
jgi:hypothetical protein